MGGILQMKLLRIYLIAPLLISLFWPVSLSAALPVNVKGLGIFKNASYERRLEFLNAIPGQEDGTAELVHIEDTAYIILQLLKREGYAHPKVQAEILYADGGTESIAWTIPFVSHESRALKGARVESIVYRCEKGILSFYRSVTVEGVVSIDSSTVQEFFIASGVLITSKKDRAYTASNLDSRVSRLLSALRNLGYQRARLVDKSAERDAETGAVDIHLSIKEGPLHEVGQIRLEVEKGEELMAPQVSSKYTGTVLNSQWQRMVRQSIHNEWYAEGYPDSVIRVERQSPESESTGDTVRMDVIFHVTTGPQVDLKEVLFSPVGLLKESVLDRQVKLTEGEPFNILKIEEGRRRLLSLGVFQDVGVEQTRNLSEGRSATYNLEPLPSQKLSLSVGWGSYELGRAGIKWEQMNMWGRAHRYQLQVRQSFKSFNGSGAYTVPQFFDEENTAYFQAGYEFREEIDFDRTNASAAFGVSRKLSIEGMEVSVEYAFEKLDTTRGSGTEFDSLDRATVSSLSLQAVLDRRDSAIYPNEGFDISMLIKTASESLGGEADFNKTEISSSYHKYLGSALYLHAALEYGVIFSKSPVSENLPFNERFFPGGDNSIRGFQRGEAAPVTATGKIIGAESYAFLSFELEQRVFRNYSVVVFWDGLSFNRDSDPFPDDEFLNSVGLGLRWRTPVGPVRLEYGHNLNPRFSDPDGTFHFAVGYPF